jgi:flagellar assembly factor FliW
MSTQTQTSTAESMSPEITFGGIPMMGIQKVDMIHGLPGFENLHHFVLAELEGYAPFCAFQSTEEGKISMLVIDAKLLSVWQGIEIPPRELAILGLEDGGQSEQFVILKIDQTTQEFTANIKAPIVFNPATGAANQVILDNADLSVEHSMQHELK